MAATGFGAWIAAIAPLILPILIVVLLYELARAVLVSTWRTAQERRVDRFMRDHRIPTDPFRHIHRVVVKEMLASDPELVSAMAKRAQQNGQHVADVQRQVRKWLDEIVPQFNLLAYYQVGVRLARTFAYSLYNVRLDTASWERAQRHIPPGATVVLVSNHRSNADFVITGFMVSKSVQVSYAVGEWARVWPLENIFRSFGSYFVRRGEKDPLYHRTLDAYIRLITRQGVTQAIFPEGGLSRDGRLREPKVGLLDSMARAKLEPAFTQPLVFLPVGINFDRVIEDEVLVRETVAGDHPLRRRTPGQKLRRVASIVGKVFIGLPVNLVRFAAKRVKKHGICAIQFGEPVDIAPVLGALGPDFAEESDRKRRHALLAPFAQELMAAIGRTIPVTPVPLLCLALVTIGPERMASGVDRGEVLVALRAATDRLQAARAPFFTGTPYASLEAARHEEAQRGGREEQADIALAIATTDDLEATLALALDVLAPRRIVVVNDGRHVVPAARWVLIEYYANSLAGHGAESVG